MPGEVIFDSILENKAATKSYWENKMREANQKNLEGWQSKKLVIDKINSEIEELHLRELELNSTVKKVHNISSGGGGGDSDFESLSEFDSFEFNTTSTSPAGDSELRVETPGNDSIAAPSPASDSRDSGGYSASFQEGNEVEHENEEILTLKNEIFQKREGEEGLLDADVSEDDDDDEEIKSPKFSTNETPIEREIRLTREREEEFRREKYGEAAGLIDLHSQEESFTEKTEKFKKIDERARSPAGIVSPILFGSKNRQEMDDQYAMATARLKKEIEESMQREAELKKGRNYTTTNYATESEYTRDEETVSPILIPPPPEQFNDFNKMEESETFEDASEFIATSTPDPDQSANKLKLNYTEEEKSNANDDRNDIGIMKSLSQRRDVGLKLTSPRKIMECSAIAPSNYNANINVNSNLNVNAISSPSPRSPIATTNSKISSEGESPLPSLVVKTPTTPFTPTTASAIWNMSKEKRFNSMERFLLRSSAKLIIAKNFEIPKETEKPAEVLPVESVKSNENANDEIDQEEEEEEKKPKRKYIPAQNKIEQELREMALREKELSVQRLKAKSMSDLLSPEPEVIASNIANSTQFLDKIDEPQPELIMPLSSEEPEKEENLVEETQIFSDEESQFLANKKQMETLDMDLEEDKKIHSSAEYLNPKANPRRRSALISKWEQLIKENEKVNE